MATVSDEMQKFHEELRWCITQLELGLQRQDPDSRQAAETVRVLKILRSSKAPLVKKRQAMRSALGDYRKKIKESEKKFLSGLRNSKFQPAGNTRLHTKSKFLKQSHSKTADRDELGAYLSNLHLQQEVPPDGSSASLGVVSMSGDASKQSGTGNIGDTSGVNSCDSSSLMPAPVSCGFQFVPSDNSFCFGFDNDDNNVDIENSDATVDGTAKSCSQINDDEVAKTNVFKYEKTDNSFAFNFTSESDVAS